jgi:hypothetical protein
MMNALSWLRNITSYAHLNGTVLSLVFFHLCVDDTQHMTFGYITMKVGSKPEHK